jgi:hypothetical protein
MVDHMFDASERRGPQRTVLLTSPRGGQDQFADSPGRHGVVITLMPSAGLFHV